MHDIFEDDQCASPEGIQFDPLDESAIACFRCGLCCTYYRVFLSLEEAQRISERTGLALDVFIEEYGSLHWYSQQDHLLRQKDGACFFLEYLPGTKEARCQIHPVRPTACREWAPGLYRRECQRGLAEYWNLTVTPFWQLQGTEENIAKFNAFLRSLADEDKKSTL
ncbi:MAG: YkgJ family cysteine cluster protein [Chloroflexota bacterium]